MRATTLPLTLLIAFIAPAVPGPLAAAPAEARRGRVAILASADMMKDECLMKKGGEHQGNVNFFHNILEVFALDERLLKIGTESGTRGGKALAISETTRALLGELKDEVRVRYYA